MKLSHDFNLVLMHHVTPTYCFTLDPMPSSSPPTPAQFKKLAICEDVILKDESKTDVKVTEGSK